MKNTVKVIHGIIFHILSLVISISSFGCKENGNNSSLETNKDTIGIVTIGNQVWMSKNLDLETFRNGDSILQAKNEEEWINAGQNKQPAWCYYDNNHVNGTKYGKLYNWYAVNDSRGLAPTGFHIPNDLEWTQLTDFLGGQFTAGYKMKSPTGWCSFGNGDNSSKFNGLPGGLRDFSGKFYVICDVGLWWSLTEYDALNVWLRSLNYDTGSVGRNDVGKEFGLSVRCLKD